MGAVSHRFVATPAGTPGATWIAATGREQPGTAGYGIALLPVSDHRPLIVDVDGFATPASG